MKLSFLKYWSLYESDAWCKGLKNTTWLILCGILNFFLILINKIKNTLLMIHQMNCHRLLRLKIYHKMSTTTFADMGFLFFSRWFTTKTMDIMRSIWRNRLISHLYLYLKQQKRSSIRIIEISSFLNPYVGLLFLIFTFFEHL